VFDEARAENGSGQAGGKMEMDLARKFRHDLRGRWHALSLCILALELADNAQEQIEMLDLLTQSVDEIDSLLEEMQFLPD
jgi:hypothetical protein